MTTRSSGSKPGTNNDVDGPSSEPDAGMSPENPPILVFEAPGNPDDDAREAAPGEGVVHPVDLRRFMTTGALIQANSGGGKSYLLRYILEQTHPVVQQILFDLEGEFASLRERFEYVVVSADGTGDLPASPESAALLCRRLIDLGASAILDLSDMDPKPQQRFTRIFIETLLTLEIRRPLVVAIDEAGRVAPEGSLGTAESTDAIVSLTSRARKRRICVMLAGHRLADLKKGAVSNLHNKFVGRVALDTDLKRAADDLGMTRSARSVLKTLEPGTFFAYGPAVSPTGITRVRSGKVLTTHYDPAEHWNVSEPRVTPPPPESVREVLAQLKDLEIEAEEETRTIDALREEVRKLRAGRAQGPAGSPDPGGREASAATRAVEVGREIDLEVERRVPAEVARVAGPLRDEISLLEATLGVARARVADLADVLTPEREEKIHAPRATGADPEAREEAPAREGAVRGDSPENHPAALTGPKPDGPPLPDAERRMLAVLAFLESRGLSALARPNLAIFTAQSPRSGAYDDHVSSLKKAGLVGYPRPGFVALTPRGSELAGEEDASRGQDVPTFLREVHRIWLSRLPGTQGRMLKVLLDLHPDDLSREELAHLTNQSPGSGAFDDHVAALGPKGLGLLEYPSPKRVRASAMLFPSQLS